MFIELARGLAFVLFVVGCWVCLCLALDMGSLHRETVAVINGYSNRATQAIRGVGHSAATVAWVRAVRLEIWLRSYRDWRLLVVAGKMPLTIRELWNEPSGSHRVVATIPARELIARLQAEREGTS